MLSKNGVNYNHTKAARAVVAYLTTNTQFLLDGESTLEERTCHTSSTTNTLSFEYKDHYLK